MIGYFEVRKLLDYIIEVIEKYFWSEEEQMCLEFWDEVFSKIEDYCGGNVNMYVVEVFLIVYDVIYDKKWLDCVLCIVLVIIYDVVCNGDYCVNEYFDLQWNFICDYNKDNFVYCFCVYGGMSGYWIEWGCLMFYFYVVLEVCFEMLFVWLLEDVKGLFYVIICDVWVLDGVDGFVYLVDWDGKFIVCECVCWLIVEVMGMVYVFYILMGDSQYEEWYQKWWDYCIKYLMDYENGFWW